MKLSTATASRGEHERTLLIRLRDKIASHVERSSVMGGGGGRNGVEASRASSPSVRASPFHSTESFTPRRPTTFPHRRCVQDDLRFFVSQPDQQENFFAQSARFLCRRLNQRFLSMGLISCSQLNGIYGRLLPVDLDRSSWDFNSATISGCLKNRLVVSPGSLSKS